MFGGLGADVFVFSRGIDRVIDFARSEADRIMIDRFLLGGQALTGAQILGAHGVVTGTHLVMDFGGGNRLVLDGLSDLTGLADQLFSF